MSQGPNNQCTYSHHEETAILSPNNGLSIIFYSRYIDDALLLPFFCFPLFLRHHEQL